MTLYSNVKEQRNELVKQRNAIDSEIKKLDRVLELLSEAAPKEEVVKKSSENTQGHRDGTQEKIIKILAGTDRPKTTEEIANALGKKKTVIGSSLNVLKRKGEIKAQKRGRLNQWTIKKGAA